MKELRKPRRIDGSEYEQETIDDKSDVSYQIILIKA